MNVKDLIPMIRKLSYTDKLFVMQVLADELAREEESLASAAEEACPLWEPPEPPERAWPEPEALWNARESLEAARSLLRERKAEALKKKENEEEPCE